MRRLIYSVSRAIGLHFGKRTSSLEQFYLKEKDVIQPLLELKAALLSNRQ